ncbi:hypothetical protein ACFC1R_03820 [Kitasatospora sp. NPDC056138]|uniref:hypothetical protein n=1 Tax=Kitasatospora sp. NPDC056138 TaxID=3345724 RepID=UPI0035D7EFC1
MTGSGEEPVARVPGPRHAAPRVSARTRLRGKALAIAAVPTVLLMGTIPSIAMADVQKDSGCPTAPDTVLEETPVPKSEITPVPDPTPTSTKSAQPTERPGPQEQQRTAQSSPTATPQPTVGATATTHPRPQQAAATGSPAPKPDASAAVPAAADSVAKADPKAGAVRPAGLLDDILDPILHLGGHRTSTPTPTPTPTPRSTPAPAGSATPAKTATEAPGPRTPEADPQAPSPGPTGTATATASAPSESSKPSEPAADPSPSASPSGGPGSTAGPSSSSSPGKDPNCQVDTRGLAAAKAEQGRVVPEQNWTLHSSTLGLYGAKFYGVVDVRTATTTKRVLKFMVDRVDIGDLDMSTLEGNGVTFHVKGAPGSTSTLRNGEVTMYVERLSGHLSKILGLPIPIDLGEITLTPDTLPQWLYDLIGSIPIPLDLELKQVTAVQAGQFGGTLHIPGMQMYNDNLPYGQ